MKKFSLIFSFCLLAYAGFSQGDGSTSVLYSMAIPIGNTSDYIDQTSFRGFAVNGDYFIEDEFSLGFSTGVQTFYQDMGTQTETRGTFSANGSQYRYLNSIPLLVTAKYHMSRYGAVTPEAGLGVGMYYMNQTVKYAGIDFSDTAWKFGLAPQVGVGIELSPSTDVFAGVNYNTAFKTKDIDAQSYLGIQVGLRFQP